MKVVPVPCSMDNYSYVLICRKTGQAAVVDPTEAYPLQRELEKHAAELTRVFCTHHHHDHVGDIASLLEGRTGVEVVCHREDISRIPAAGTAVDDGAQVAVGEVAGRVMHTPGHTRGSVCYRFGEHLFVGDTLFGAGCGRLFEGEAEQMFHSLNKLASLPEETHIYFGHEYTRKNLEFALSVEPGNVEAQRRLERLLGTGAVSTPTTLALEKKTNPFLRCDSEEIRTRLILQGEAARDEIEVFAALRRLRNAF